MRASIQSVIVATLCGIAGLVAGHILQRSVVSTESRSPTSLQVSEEPQAPIHNPGIRFSEEVGQCATAADFIRLLEVAKSDLERRIIVSRWTQTDGKAALDWAKSPENKVPPHLVFEEWALNDPTAALAAISEESRNRAEGYRYKVMSSLADGHPDVFFDLIANDPSLRCPDEAWDTAFARLFATIPDAAKEAFGRLNQTSQNAAALAFARQWAEISPEEALKWAEGIKGDIVLQAALTVIARSHPLEALRKLSLPGKALSEVIRSALSELDPETLMKACGTVKDNRFLIQSAMNAVLEKELAADPQKAFALLDLVRADGRSSSIQHLATNCPLDRASDFLPWLQSQSLGDYNLAKLGVEVASKMIDPNAPEGSIARLRATIEKLADGALRDSLTATLDADEALRNGDFGTFASWVKKAGDAGKAVGMAKVQRLKTQSLASAVQLASTFSRHSEYQNLLTQWFEGDSKAATAWASNPPEWIAEENRPATALASFIGTYDPKQAAAWVTSLNGAARNEATAGLASRWAGSNPKEAAAWASAIEESELRAQAFGSIARTWFRDDPYESTAWLATLERGALRDRTIATMVDERWLNRKPTLESKTALRWLSDIDSAEVRRSVLARMVDDGGLLDSEERRASAESLLLSSGISSDDIRTVLSAAEKEKEESHAESDPWDPFRP